MTAVVENVSPGRWCIRPPEGACKMRPAGELPGYKNQIWPYGITGWVEHFFRDNGFPTPQRVNFYAAAPNPTPGTGQEHDRIYVTFPRKRGLQDSSRRRRKCLEAVAKFFVAGEWIMLCFESDDDMASFIKAITEMEPSIDRDQIRVGINAVNIHRSLHDEIKNDLGPDRFNYTVRDI